MGLPYFEALHYQMKVIANKSQSLNKLLLANNLISMHKAPMKLLAQVF
jgi:hypothetical protein